MHLPKTRTLKLKPIDASFRDPSGYLFERDDVILRKINASYLEEYNHLMSSGLYEELTHRGLLISHTELTQQEQTDGGKVIEPQQLKYVSYPYEWCFSQLKDFALLTLKVQLLSMKYGMSLKDASVYNVQLHEGKPCFIDTLSFEKYQEGSPWKAYRQFCQHFLAPLALISYRDYRLNKLLTAYMDGIPLDLASQLLPRKSWFSYGILAHIHLHAMSQIRHADDAAASKVPSQVQMSRTQLEGLLGSLQNITQKLQWQPPNTEWGDYYSATNYVDEAMQYKESLVRQLVKECSSDGTRAADFGANTGRFSRIAMSEGYQVLSCDVDEVAVEKNYRQMRNDGETGLVPLLQDITNPSPGIGWMCSERDGFLQRTRVDLGMALALIHHIAISNNVPLERCAAFFHSTCDNLIIEFVPKEDSQVRRLLATREDIFPHYTKEGFEAAFGKYFSIENALAIPESERFLYLMSKS